MILSDLASALDPVVLMRRNNIEPDPWQCIAFCQDLNPLGRHHDILMANVLAQSEALAFGKTREQVAAEGLPDWLQPHRVFEGIVRRIRSLPRSCAGTASPNKPNWGLTPAVLGKLVALYEHIVFVQGAIWNVNPFDQWGVELGKIPAQRIVREFRESAGAASERQLDRPSDPVLSRAQ